MREIIFRGKREDNGEGVEGYYVCVSGVKHYILTGNPVIAPNNITIECYGVIPETVGQYTGLKDKNGKKVFEGDICDCYGDIGVIEFDEEDSMFIYTYAENVSTNFGCLYGTELEVIGNVHDNPEIKIL